LIQYFIPKEKVFIMLPVKNVIIAGVILFLFAAGCSKPPQVKTVPHVQDYPVGLCFAREMDYLPEVDSWQQCSTGVYDSITRLAVADWQKKCGFVQSQVTPQLVASLSQWAKEQMKEYDSVPDFCNVALTAVREFKDHGKIVLEGTLDTLPSHSPIVTRWLKVYTIYDIHNEAITRATITIKGEILE